ncbi:hypothetical protein MMC19_007222 [Ptychographa xylographoides]|nr:hypothetical protein [Ptychographa xylographoides]
MPSYSSAERDYNDARTRVSNCRAEVDRRSQDLQGKQAYLAEVKDPRNGRSSKTIKNAEISVKKRIDILSDAKNELEDAMRRENSAQSRLRSEQWLSPWRNCSKDQR